ncbi:aminotransferase class I/II-fold pyridoxal phosphate-dependent enzyme [Evansella tamaricis]|uniref:Aminotransferase class I/II-fold pyridoxal phosphate-dependent enzyme n=1 Tax=Evansella tamaricis TaxID=2069301 RepID=A0ABS6JJE8_9BACI|nr:aminotransferase class I/II-fold pyridoxal phosphate-dependent enzyme [Evansella tamaricis]MBU9713711.1 aminotransferase class I/II-fold pyridoxal phosphate-dependent enzyme [Evansella tamaricis]
MDQNRTPLFDKLMEHKNKISTSFHVPGHKNGRVFSNKGKELFQHILELDVTEISGMDDLHHPQGVIKEAQEMTAETYGVKSSRFLVGGSTVGNIAMIMSTVKTGDSILVQRNSHQSIFHGIELSGARAVYLYPEVDKESGLSLGLSEEVVAKAINQYPEAKALVLTNPTYEGYGQALDTHISRAHNANMLVLVDEAHGAHFVMEDCRWPKSAIRSGADIVVQSAHKMLPAMTMTAFLHCNSLRVNEEKLDVYLRMLQSSSPSYPLMASLDLARAYVWEMKNSEEEWRSITEKLERFKDNLEKGDGWFQSGKRIGSYTQDLLKVAFISTTSVTGDMWKAKMESLNAFPELSSPNHLLITLPWTKDELPFGDWEKIIRLSLNTSKEVIHQKPLQQMCSLSISEPVLTINELDECKTERISFWDCEGKIAAETIIPYPPGIPLIIRGEEITKSQIEALNYLGDNNSYFQSGMEWKEKGVTVVTLS